MLKRFTVSNFKNFGDGLTLDLCHPANYAFNGEVVRDGVKTKGIVYGANGSGKSNLGLALFDIVIHVTDKERALAKYQPYLNLGSGAAAAEFEYVFEFGGEEVVYRYGKSGATELTHEELLVGGAEVLAFDFANGDGHVELSGAESLQITSSLPAAGGISRVKFVRSNAILQDSPETRAFDAFVRFVDSMLMFYSLDEKGYQGLSVGQDSFTRGIIRAGKVGEFGEFLAAQGVEYDLAAVDVDGREELYCRYGGATVPFMTVASTGTRSLALFYYWYIRMGSASLVFIDEFDAFYHFELAESIVEMLRGLGDVQVFLTTHNTDLLSNDLLRPDAYFYLRGGRVDSLDRLTDKELRSAHNLQKMFKAGSFDG